jgi:putative membrane protein
MTRFILRWAINAAALYVAVALLPGRIQLIEGASWASVIWLALIFGLVNALVRPVVKVLSCPLILLTFGLFTLVINTLMFALTGWIGNQFGVGLIIVEPWFWNAFLGALIVSLVSLLLSGLFRDQLKKGR